MLPISVDDVFPKLPGYNCVNTAQYREVASSIADHHLFSQAITEGRNFKVEWVGKNAITLEKAIDLLHEKGYRIELIHVHVTPEESMRRAITRFRRKEGPFVDPLYIRDLVGTRPDENFSTLVAKLDPSKDAWVHYDNMVSRGTPAREVARGGKWPQREHVIRRMCEVGERIGEADLLLPGLITLCGLYFNRGEAIRGLELGKRCLELAKLTGDAGLLGDAHHNVALLASSSGKLREALLHLDDAILYRDRRSRGISLLGAGLLPTAGRFLMRAITLQLLGRVDEAAKCGEVGLRQARESRHLFSLGLALALRALLSNYRREPKVARALAEEAIALGEENGFGTWLAYGQVGRGCALAELGRFNEAIADMEAGIAGFRRIGGAVRLQYYIAQLARGYATVGQTEKGLTMLNDALAQIERTGQKVDYAEMLRFKGEMLLMHDARATEQAESCFRAALDVARSQEARWWELRTSVSLARLLRDANRRDEARAMLSEIYNWFTEGFEFADLKDTKALLDELGT